MARATDWCHSEDKPQLVRSDFVQNSNDSFWVSNSKEPLTGFSPLYGAKETEQSARTRLGLKMLLNPQYDGFSGDQNQAKWPAGQDGKFSARDLIETVYNNRSFWAEEFLPELRARCFHWLRPLSTYREVRLERSRVAVMCSRTGAVTMTLTVLVRTCSGFS